jgi:hypothetical protein
MRHKSDIPCWEIMKCEGTESCPARKSPGTPCWEIARDLDDYRSAFNICKDCLVYMLKHENTVLSQQEIETIIEKKGFCVLAETEITL